MPVPGGPHRIIESGRPEFEGTGKSGSPAVQRSGEVFPITVRAVDQYFNLVHTVDDGQIQLSSSGGALDLVVADVTLDLNPLVLLTVLAIVGNHGSSSGSCVGVYMPALMATQRERSMAPTLA